MSRSQGKNRACLIAFMAAAAFMGYHNSAHAMGDKAAPSAEVAPANTEPLTINKHVFNVEVARTMKELEQGLMFRTDIADDGGMLFLFPSEQDASFWMKNTFIPLDMLFITRDGTILSIHENAVPQDLTPLSAGGLVLYGLELKGGAVARTGIKIGDKISNKSFFSQ